MQFCEKRRSKSPPDGQRLKSGPATKLIKGLLLSACLFAERSELDYAATRLAMGFQMILSLNRG